MDIKTTVIYHHILTRMARTLTVPSVGEFIENWD